MNDDLMFEYLLQMGGMRPEQDQLKKKQAMVDALRKQALEPLQGQMVGKQYVAPGIGQAIAQMGTAYLAGQQQQGVDKGYFNKDFNPEMPEGPNNVPGLNQKQRLLLENLRKKKRGAGVADYNVDAISNEYFGGGE